MKKIVLFKRLLFPLLIVGTLSILISAFYMFTFNLKKTQEKATYETQKLEHVLTMAKSLVSEQVYSSMELLKQKTFFIGLPNLNGETELNGKRIPNLQLGSEPQTNQAYLVDSVTTIGNGTATIFVKKANSFIRIATNVRINNNVRAIGTQLDPKGDVIKKLILGKPFYGVVDILGEPYISGYEPIIDAHHQVIGAWYVGYKVNVNALDQAIKQWSFLENGFAAITDYNDNIRFLSQHIDVKKAKIALKLGNRSWFVTHKDIPEWNFHAYIAFPLKDAYLTSIAPLYPLFILSGIFGVLLIMLAHHGIKRLVLTPIGGEPETASRLVKAIEQGDFDDDDTVTEPGTVIANMLKMRTRLREMVKEIKEKSDRLTISSSVFQHSHDGIFITNAQAKIIETNPAFTDITGYSRKEALSRQPNHLGFAYQLDTFLDRKSVV